MTEQDYLARIRELMQARFDNISPVEEIELDTDLMEDLPLESLDMVDLILSCETAFNVKLDMADAKNTHTIRQLIAWIEGAK